MKKRILYTVLLAAGLAFSSCSDQFLQDMNPYDSYSPEKTCLLYTSPSPRDS